MVMNSMGDERKQSVKDDPTSFLPKSQADDDAIVCDKED